MCFRFNTRNRYWKEGRQLWLNDCIFFLTYRLVKKRNKEVTIIAARALKLLRFFMFDQNWKKRKKSINLTILLVKKTITIRTKCALKREKPSQHKRPMYEGTNICVLLFCPFKSIRLNCGKIVYLIKV